MKAYLSILFIAFPASWAIAGDYYQVDCSLKLAGGNAEDTASSKFTVRCNTESPEQGSYWLKERHGDAQLRDRQLLAAVSYSGEDKACEYVDVTLREGDKWVTEF